MPDLDQHLKSVDSASADTDLQPAQSLLQSMEAPQPCAMPGDEAELLPDNDPGSSTLCVRCKNLAQVPELKTRTDVSRWLRACGFSRSVATRMGHAWPRETEPKTEGTAAPSPILASIKSMIAALEP